MSTAYKTHPIELGADWDDGLQHGAHITCQEGAPFVVLACGIAADWNEQRDHTAGRDSCPMCWNVDHCPICGMRLIKS